MALLFLDGFEYFDKTKWQRMDGFSTYTFIRTGGYNSFGGGALQLASQGAGSAVTYRLPASGGFVFGAAIFWSVTGALDLLQAMEDVWPTRVTHLSLSTNTLNQPCVKCGGTVIATGTRVFTQGTFYYIEFKGTIDAVAGSFSVRINGIPEPGLTVSGVTTKNGGTGQWTRLGLQGNGYTFFDDLYVCDQSGPRNNTFLGMVHIDTVLPQTDAVAAGSNHAWTPSTGTDHGAIVGNPTQNTNNFNSSSTVGAKDTYNLPPVLAAGSLCRGMQITMTAKRTDLNTRLMCSVVRVGGVDYEGPTIAPSNQFVAVVQPWEINPATGLAWTPADLDAIEAGMKVTA